MQLGGIAHVATPRHNSRTFSPLQLALDAAYEPVDRRGLRAGTVVTRGAGWPSGDAGGGAGTTGTSGRGRLQS